MNESRPALTGEQWMWLHSTGVQALTRVHIRVSPEGLEMQDQPFGGSEEIRWGAWAGKDNRHKLAAVALHGQPFGFTWEDVDMLRSTPSEYDGSPHEDGPYHDLADRIAALLPPREHTP